MKILIILAVAILSLAAFACAQPSPTVTPDIPATVTARLSQTPTVTPRPTYTRYPTGTPRPTYTRYPTATPYPTGTPRPTYTRYPTATPYPTGTPRPTYTRYPTATPYPTGTPRPTQTPLIRYIKVTPSPTATPLPTPTPAIPLSQRYGIPGSPVTVREFKRLPNWQSTSEKRAVVGCSVGSASNYRGEKFYTFTHDGESNRWSDYVAVTGFPEGTVGNVSLPCFEMVVWYEKTLTHWYWTCTPICPENPTRPPDAWEYETPLLALINASAYKGLTKAQWRALYR